MVTEFVEARVAEPQAKIAGVAQVLRNVIRQDLECTLDP
jgi:hypothetical protein